MADPQECGDRPGAAPERAGLAGVPAIAGTGILALNFFTADLLNGAKIYVLAAIEHGTRRVRVLGAHRAPGPEAWVVRQARNLLMDLEDAGMSVKFALHDRDAGASMGTSTTLTGLHRSLGQLTPAQADTRPPEPIDLADHRVGRKQVLTGLTHEYYVAALPTRCHGKQVPSESYLRAPHAPSATA